MYIYTDHQLPNKSDEKKNQQRKNKSICSNIFIFQQNYKVCEKVFEITNLELWVEIHNSASVSNWFMAFFGNI